MHFSRSVICLVLGAAGSTFALNLRSMSFNIRFANKDVKSGSGENLWSGKCGDTCRAPGVIAAIGNADKEAMAAGGASLIGLQEALEGQITDIVEGLNKMNGTWGSIGVAREDGATKGEYNPILYRTDVWNMVKDVTKWLSTTPDKPSKSFGAGSTRIVTMGVFEHKATKKRVIRVNTHLDNASAEARSKGVGIVVDQIKAFQAAQADPKTALPVALSGDFNADQSDPAYQDMVKLGFVEDGFNMVPAGQRKGELATFTGFKNEFNSRIDFVWLGPLPNNPFKATAYQVLSNDGPNKVRFSDHRPVVVDATLA